ncbi:MAG TPA: DUF1592 domain-containing protein [Pirellulales bacterium]
MSALLTVAFSLFSAAVLPAAEPASESPSSEASPGAKIYQSQCIRCHGVSGQGTRDPVIQAALAARPDTAGKDLPEPLVGDKSVAELAAYIEKSMPEDSPKKCTADEARQVADYLYNAFYSPVAQARNRPARIELARLTVRQYQNALADLIAGFRGDAVLAPARGLRGEYFKSRDFRNDQRPIQRIDPCVNFDFGDTGPEPSEADQFDPRQFTIRWSGSLLAPETGDYDFAVVTEHAVRLWINDQKQPLIDAWVKSGNDTEHRASIHLLAGRAYPLRLEFSKAKQGVDDSDKLKTKPLPVKATIALRWRLPHGVDDVVPQRCLAPQEMPEVFAVQTAFPPDDRSEGYERGTSISQAWDQATTEAAIETADYIANHLNELAKSKDADTDRAAKLKRFCYRLVERAFRRPLTDDQKSLFVDRQFAAAEASAKSADTKDANQDNSNEANQSAAKDLSDAVKRCALLTLKSPRFLYREIAPAKNTAQYDVAARLSFGLWDSLPDKELLRAAKAGELTSPEQVHRQAQRMLADERCRNKLHQFFLQWLKVDEVRDLSKDAAQYPQFTNLVAADLRASLELFVDQIVWSDNSDFRELFTSTYLPLNARLAKFYGVERAEAPPSERGVVDDQFQSVEMEPDHRAGVLTHPYLLATFAHAAASSPIHRGVFISRNLLGRALRPPPEAQIPLPPDLHPDLTTRQRVELQTQSESCMVCHATINPLGFTLENFDAVGRFRLEEQGRAIDATGKYQTRGGETEQFKSVRDLAQFLANSDEAHRAFIEQLFHHLVKQPMQAYGPKRMDELLASFGQNEFNIQKLAAEIVAGAAIINSPSPRGEGRGEGVNK